MSYERINFKDGVTKLNAQALNKIDEACFNNDSSLTEISIKLQTINAALDGRVKEAAQLVSVDNVDLTAATSTIDGVEVKTNDRVLFIGQTDKTQNGIYKYTGTAWERTEDADLSENFSSGFLISIKSGTENADTVWTFITDTDVILGTTELNFSKLTEKVDLASINTSISELALKVEELDSTVKNITPPDITKVEFDELVSKVNSLEEKFNTHTHDVLAGETSAPKDTVTK